MTEKMVYLQCAAKIAAEPGSGVPKFTMTAYTGQPMMVGYYDDPVVINLEGIGLDRQQIPIFYAHDSYKGVGHTEAIRVEDGALIAEGKISRSNTFAQDVIESGLKGFPWQASVGGYITARRDLPEGETAQINGRTIEGPALIAERFELKEISFVELGADDNTSATVSAAKHFRKEKEMEKKETLNAGAVDKVLGSAPEQTPDVSQIVAEAVKAGVDGLKAELQKEADERRRVDEINARAAGIGNPELQAQAIKEGWSADKFELEALRASRAAVPFVPTGGNTYTDETLEAAALMTSGLSDARIVKAFARGDEVAASAERLRGIGLREMIEIAAHQRGTNLGTFRGNNSGWLRAAFSTAGLSGLLSNTLNKGLLEWYNAGDQGWRKIVNEVSVKDFKAYEQNYLVTSFAFEEVAPGGEIKDGSASDETFTNRARTYAVKFALDRQMLINDDLGAFMAIPKRLGQAAARTLGKRVWAAILGNANSGDGNAFFSAAHNNLITGADYALGVDGLSYARAVFAKQTDQNGDAIDVLPAFLAAPPELSAMAEMLYSATYVNETTAQNKARPNQNPNAGKVEPVISAQLSNAKNTGYSSTAYYLFADPNVIPAVQVAYLNGVKVPKIEQGDLDFDRLGIGFRAYFDYGVALVDYRGALKVTGAN